MTREMKLEREGVRLGKKKNGRVRNCREMESENEGERERKTQNGSMRTTKEKCDEIRERMRAAKGRRGENVRSQERVKGGKREQ